MTAPLPSPEACDTCNGSGVYGDDTCPGGCDRGAKVLTARALPTPEDVAQMRERHVQTPGDETQPWPYEWCQYDGQDWPCDAARLLALVDSQRVRMQHLENVFAQQDDRLAAVLAECDRAEEGHRDVLAEVFEYAPEPAMVHVDRIRRAATGEGT